MSDLKFYYDLIAILADDTDGKSYRTDGKLLDEKFHCKDKIVNEKFFDLDTFIKNGIIRYQ